MVWLAVPALVVVATLAALREPPDQRVRYIDVPVAVLPLPAAAPAPSDPTASELPPAEPTAPKLSVVEPDATRTAPAVERPPLLKLEAAEPDPLLPLPTKPARTCRKPCVAVVVSGLGLAREASQRALAALPAPVGLSFSPYAGDLDGWLRRAAADGHEVLLDLPLQPVRYPADDPGPLTLTLAASPEEFDRILQRLLRVRGAKVRGAVAAAGAFAAEPARFGPIAAALAERGLILVEHGGAALGGVAGAHALTHALAVAPGADEAGAVAFDRVLEAVEGEARNDGRALGLLPLTPLAVARLAAWIPTLPGKGVDLVPPGLLIQGAPERSEAMTR